MNLATAKVELVGGLESVDDVSCLINTVTRSILMIHVSVFNVPPRLHSLNIILTRYMFKRTQSLSNVLQMTRNKIQLSTSSQKCLTLQPVDETEFCDWLYAVSPLLVGQLRSDPHPPL